MAEKLYITATEGRSGKSAICLGVMEMLLRKIDKVGFFRPVVSRRLDDDVALIASHFGLDAPAEQMIGFTMAEANDLIAAGDRAQIIDGVLKKVDLLDDTFDFILCEGTDFASSAAAFEFDINARISTNLGCPVLLVASAWNKTAEAALDDIELALNSLNARGCNTIATIVNRVDPADGERIVSRLVASPAAADQLVYAIPNDEVLGKPTLAQVAEALGAEVLCAPEKLNRPVRSFTVAAMQLANLLPRIQPGTLIITPGDRADVLAACAASLTSKAMPDISGIVLTGGLRPAESVWQLIEGSGDMVPVLSVATDTFPTATAVDDIHSTIAPGDTQRINRALALFDGSVDTDRLGEKAITTEATIVTPKMFEYGLVQRARKDRQHIVLPEGEEERILRATDILLRREVADLTLLGREDVIRRKISQLALQIEDVMVIDPGRSVDFDDYARTYYALRKHKGITPENARDLMSEVSYFGTMMVYKHQADGMVSGAAHSTIDTVRPSFEFVKTKPGFSIVSSVFFMCLSRRVLVYGDCAVNPNPTAPQLAEIAVSSAKTARTFGVEPVVAMLSYSTDRSGRGRDVDRVREATRLARALADEACPGLKIEGPIQYDAAVDPQVAATKLPNSDVAGRATVFIFPDLNTGNNTYKAVQRSAGAVAVGPVMQGLKYPVNDLSRGCTVADIVNTVAITAIQAQSDKREG